MDFVYNSLEIKGCQDPLSPNAGTGGPKDGSFTNLATKEPERRFLGGNILDEFVSQDSNVKGTLSMANTGQANSGGSQFFINAALESKLKGS